MKPQTPSLVFMFTLLSSLLTAAAQANCTANQTVFKQVSAIDSAHPPTFTDYKSCRVTVTEAAIGLSMPALFLGAAAIIQIWGLWSAIMKSLQHKVRTFEILGKVKATLQSLEVYQRMTDHNHGNLNYGENSCVQYQISFSNFTNQSYYFSKCRADPKHIQLNRDWDECNQAEANDCADAPPAKGKGGKMLVMGSSKRPSDCPQCPLELPQV
ncbi:hypothetical protein BKA61DRAFT_573735 [Leptodontidium sp. MPI-SDFR-AT-0119]|nr:hypothetical protein BKA61DRAFT_573735 [Leptodontidium sp. MPI-SDFR-AT-0119]